MSHWTKWKDCLPDPLAGLNTARAGDGAGLLRAARFLLAADPVRSIVTRALKTPARDEDGANGPDRLKRIEAKIGTLLEQSRDRAPTGFQPDEMTSREAAAHLGISKETLLKLVRASQLARRNVSPPGSGKPRFRYRIADLDRLKREGFHLLASPSVPSIRARKKRPVVTVKSKHLDLD